MKSLMAVLVLISTQFAFAGDITGSVLVYSLKVPATTKVIKISGDAAEELWKSYWVDELVDVTGGDQYSQVLQKVGPNITCMRGKTVSAKFEYTCEMTIDSGVVQPGGAG